MPSTFVTNADLSITAAIADSKTITVTGSGVVTVYDAILSTQAFGGLPSGTIFSLGGVASATAMPGSFITNAALSITAAVANMKTVTGSGAVTVSDAILSTQAFGGLPSDTVFNAGGVADVSMPGSFVTNDALSITAAVATGKTVTGSGDVTVSDAISSAQAFGGLPSGTVFSLGGDASTTAMPSTFVTNADLSITAAIANGKTITGSGVVTVYDAILSAQAFGGLPSGTIFSLGGVASATAMPSSFVTNAALSITAAVSTGKTITGSGVVTVSNAILSTQAFGGLPSDTIFSLGGVASATAMPASFVTNAALSITAAIANGKTITGSGVVTVSTAILSTQAFGGLPSDTIFSIGGVASATTMPASFVTNGNLSITAAIANGKTVTGSGVVTVSDAIESEQAFGGLPSDTIFSLGGVADVSMPATFVTNGNLSITAAVATGKTVTGSGVVTVSTATLSGQYFRFFPDGTIFSLGGVLDNTVPPNSFVTNGPLVIDASLATDKTITGTGVVTVSGFYISNMSFAGLPNGTIFTEGSGYGEVSTAMPNIFVTNAEMRINADIANGKTITSNNSSIVSIRTPILAGQNFAGLPNGTKFHRGGVADTGMPTAFVTNHTLYIKSSIADGKTISTTNETITYRNPGSDEAITEAGVGSVIVDTSIETTQNFAGLPTNKTTFLLGGTASAVAANMPNTFVTNGDLSITAEVATGKTITGSGVVTVSDAISSTQAFGGLPSGTVFSLGGVASATAMPSSFVTNGDLSITSEIANSKTITGSGVVTVTNAILISQIFGNLPNGTIFYVGGNASYTSMPSSFVTDGYLSITAAVASGKTVTGSGAVTVSNAILSTQAFGGLPSGTVFNAGGVADTAMPSSFVTNDALSITAAIANGKTITGSGAVTVTDAILSGQDFGSLPSGTVFNAGGVASATAMPSSFVTNGNLSITAAVADGKTITVTGSSVVTVSDAISSTQAFGGLPNGTVFSLGGTTDIGMPVSFVTNGDLSITAEVASGVIITGLGTVTVTDIILAGQDFTGLPSGTIFNAGGETDVGMPASFVTKDNLLIASDVADAKTITTIGSGITITINSQISNVQNFTGLPYGTIFNAGSTSTFAGSFPNEFVLNSGTYYAPVASVNGKNISGSGNLTIRNWTDAINSDFSNINLTDSGFATVTYSIDVNVTLFAGKLKNLSDKISLFVAAGKTFSISQHSAVELADYTDTVNSSNLLDTVQVTKLGTGILLLPKNEGGTRVVTGAVTNVPSYTDTSLSTFLGLPENTVYILRKSAGTITINTV
jgi:hypothetical protein